VKLSAVLAAALFAGGLTLTVGAPCRCRISHPHSSEGLAQSSRRAGEAILYLTAVNVCRPPNLGACQDERPCSCDCPTWR
jgi:hypothetical protein